MALATWWASDPLMDLTPLSDFHVRLSADDARLATINQITVAEVEQRRRAGHLPYVGYMDGTAVTYGWVATREASIGELNLAAFGVAAICIFAIGISLTHYLYNTNIIDRKGLV